MSTEYNLSDSLSFFGEELIAEISESAIIKEIPKGTEILREGQYINVIPVVLDGLIKMVEILKICLYKSFDYSKIINLLL